MELHYLFSIATSLVLKKRKLCVVTFKMHLIPVDLGEVAHEYIFIMKKEVERKTF
jgi:hypothetical protein